MVNHTIELSKYHWDKVQQISVTVQTSDQGGLPDWLFARKKFRGAKDNRPLFLKQ